MDGIFDGMNISRSKVEVVSIINFSKVQLVLLVKSLRMTASSRKRNLRIYFYCHILFAEGMNL